MIALRLKVLGEFEARDGEGRQLSVAAKKNRALLAALALAPSCSMPRERIASLLWSDRGETQARSSLRQALLALRKDLATTDRSPFSAGEERVKLDPVRIEVDAVLFQRFASTNDMENLRRAAELSRGELLAGTDIRDPAFEAWVASERRRLADLAVGVLDKLCILETGAARIDVARRLVALDPLREASHRSLMLAYAEAGEKALALRQYEACRDALRDQLNVAPSEETETLRLRLLRNSLETAEPGATGDAAAMAVHLKEAADPTGTVPMRNAKTFEAKTAVAVLPFDVMGSDANLDHFSDGLTEDIITGLSRIKSIWVVARNTSFTYKRRAVDIRTFARELGVQYVLEGSVRKSDARFWSNGSVDRS